MFYELKLKFQVRFETHNLIYNEPIMQDTLLANVIIKLVDMFWLMSYSLL